MTSTPRAARLSAAVALITAAVTGCAATATTATASFSTRAGGTGTATPGASVTPAPSAAASAANTAAAANIPSARPGPRLSASGGTMQFVHRPGDPFAATATATAGTVLQVRLEPAGGYRWTTVTSTDPQIAQVTATSADTSGAATATVTLRAPGTASLTATTSYQPDPHGPPTRLWRLTMTITP